MNPQQRKQLIIVGVLGVVFVAVLIYQISRPLTPPPPGAAPDTKSAAGTQAPSGAAPSASTAAPSASSGTSGSGASGKTELKRTNINIDDLLANIREVDFDYDRDRMPRDPLTPLVGKMAKAKPKEGEDAKAVAPATTIEMMNKSVTGIIWDSRRPLAVVDDEVVYPGYEYPNKAVVESITRDRVVFKVGDSLIEVPLKEL